MSEPNPSTALGRVVADEMAAAGLGMVVVSPGSRSAALAIAAHDHPGLDTRVVLDERSAGFFALGRGKAEGRPTALLCTSGTAAANYLPAVVEADSSSTPLLVLSADRPARLQGVGANQTINQRDLFGSRLRHFAHIEAPDGRASLASRWRQTVREAIGASMGAGSRPGPAHLNIAFEEPTVPVSDDGRSRAEPYPFGLGERGPVYEPEPPRPPSSGRAPAWPTRTLVIAGDGAYDRTALVARATERGLPVLGTALSGARQGGALAHYHHVLAGGVPGELTPDAVLAVGRIGPSPRLERLASSAPVRVRIDSWGRTIDPGRDATEILAGDPVEALSSGSRQAEEGWLTAWRAADGRAGEAVRSALASHPAPTGPGIAAALDGLGWEALAASSSLPIRDVDALVRGPGVVIGNRGASGIDGFVSTARGVASVVRRTVALAGDLALFHDANGLLFEPEDDLALVVVDNGGGGLFDLLPPAEHAPAYERLFVAPQRRSLEGLARFHEAPFHEAGEIPDLVKAVAEALDRGGTRVIRVVVDRSEDVAVRRWLDRLASEAVRQVAGS